MADLRPAATRAGAPALPRGPRRGRAAHSLTSLAGEAELAAWLAEPADPGAWAGLTRYLLAFHAASPALRLKFPELDGPGALGYSEWLRAHADRDPDLPAALAPAAIEIDGRSLEPLLLSLFGERATPLPEFLAWLGEPARTARRPARRATSTSSTGPPGPAHRVPAVGPELVAWARAFGVREHPQLGELLYASPERAGAGSLG